MEWLWFLTAGLVAFTAHNLWRIWTLTGRRWLAWKLYERRLSHLSAHDRLRVHMAALGSPVWDMTDEELEDGATRMAALVRSTGLTVDEAAEGLRLGVDLVEGV